MLQRRLRELLSQQSRLRNKNRANIGIILKKITQQQKKTIKNKIAGAIMKLTTIVLSFFLVFICLSIQAQENIKWIDAKTIKVEGKGWQETEGNFDRFPLKAKEILPNGLFDAGQQTPGIAIRFKTNSSTLKLKWTNPSQEKSKSLLWLMITWAYIT